MAKKRYLVIVESPTKAKTISHILDKEYEVTSSMGHIVDLPAKRLSVDIDKRFRPYYRVIPGKEKIVRALKDKAKDKEVVYLATDPDREGEAISWHIKNLLSSKNDKLRFYRLVFHEITESAMREAFNLPSDVNMNMVNAQKTRRILDRIVGYYLSPILWKKISRGLSAGRVQSVALKFIVDREEEIHRFVPTTTYLIKGTFLVGDKEFVAKLVKFGGREAEFKSKEEALKIVEELKKESFVIKKVEEKESKRPPPPSFTTSLLQQDAFTHLRFSSKKTMMVAQRLYEGVNIAGKMCGLITYMRTDSFRVADKAKKEVKMFIQENFGEDYVCVKEYKHKEKATAQLAHEAIRPTDTNRIPSLIKKYLKPDEYNLYELIWRRFVASFMREAKFKFTKVSLIGGKAEFSAEGKNILFPGFLKVWGKEEEVLLPPLKEKDEVVLQDLAIIEKITKPPPRFTDASLVKLLENKGIGRPSTYAPTISTLLMRNYIRREKGHFVPTELGIKTLKLLVNNFPEIINENFTAKIEEKLDQVEEGKLEGEKVLEEFYYPFKEKVDSATVNIKKQVEYADRTCPLCGSKLVVKWSRKGKFLSCSRYPECSHSESITTEVRCPQCREGYLIQRRNRKGQFFYGCSRFPKCDYTTTKLPK